MRINLSTDLKTRTGAPSTKDARQVNSYVEIKGDQSVVRKRPAAQGGIAVGTGTAQGGIGLTINGTPYFIGFWADTMQTATLSSLANGGPYGYSTTLQYNVGDFVDYVASPPSDPFANPPIITRYYAYGPSSNKNPATNPNLWSTSPAPSTRYYAFGGEFDGSATYTGDICATTIAATQNLYDKLTRKTCPGVAPYYLWASEPITVVGLNGFCHQYGTAGIRQCGDPNNDGGAHGFATIIQTA